MAYQRAKAEFDQEGISVVAGSIDPADKAEQVVREDALGFVVLHSLPLQETARTLTSFYETRRGILHATGFVIRPDATIGTACYSTGPIGRLEPDDVLRVVRFWKKRAQAK